LGDVQIAGHNHDYERTHQLAPTTTTSNAVVADSDGDFVSGNGTILAVVGNGGHNSRTVTQAWWQAVVNGTNSAGGVSYGHVEVEVTTNTMTYKYVPDYGNMSLSDSWVMKK
ncbi:MAG: hypothetical protein KDA17_04770, partial [Candidatus Saccharibacteria bacterium]|nr:hypothetical protein [Candidatus Saccharibacteria bacterium]